MNGTLEISGLSKSYREPVLDHLDLTIDGGVFALLGPNGAGKTTLVSILTTLVRPDSGCAHIGGVDILASPREARRLFAATGQETTLDDLLTGRENLVMLGRLLGLGRGASRRADRSPHTPAACGGDSISPPPSSPGPPCSSSTSPPPGSTL